MAKILIIDDERSVRNVLKETLEHEGYEVDLAIDASEAMPKLNNETCYDLVLCDAKFAVIDGKDFIELIHNCKPSTQVVATSGMMNMEGAIEIMKRGVADFLFKPIDLSKLLSSVKSSMDGVAYGSERAKNNIAKATAAKNQRFAAVTREIIGNSGVINFVKDMIAKVGASEARVLITGANGTGKELVARALHEMSSRRGKPFVEVNCAAIPSDLIESELFGHDKGAFTSAIRDRKGKFEQANGGTLFMDEIGDMSLAAQAKVLRALQEKKISRVGSDKDMEVNVRVIAATNKNLFQEIERSTFREDLFHRLNVVKICVPTLEERLDDIPLLVDSFLNRLCADYNIPTKQISSEAMTRLQKMKWPGNIRQLHNVVERLIILGDDLITLDDVKKYAEEI